MEKSTPSAGLSQEEIQKNQSFTESLITKIIENLQITIRNIHIRYEDKTSVPGHPFSLGFTLEELSAISTDDEWNPMFIQKVSQVTRKLAKLNSLAIYWNTDSDSIRRKDDTEGEESTLDLFKSMIVVKEKAELNQYILKPVSGMGRITLNKVPMDSQPKSKIQLIFDELGFVFDSDQYRDALWTGDLFRLYMHTKDFKRFRPSASVKEDPKAWFKYAGDIVLNQIHEKRRQWTWDYINMRLQTRKRYVELYKIRCKNTPQGTLSNSDELAEFNQLEFDLSYEDIRFYRSLAKNEIRKERAKLKEEQQLLKEENNDGGSASLTSTTAASSASSAAAITSWTSWIWGGGNANAASSASAAPDDEPVAMTEEQKKELYDAIEWDEKSAVEKSIEIPKTQITLEVETALESGSFKIRNDPHGTPHDVAAVYFNGFKAKFLQRPTSFLTNISLQEFRVDDKTEGTLFEQIVTVKPLSHEDDHLHHNGDLSVSETNGENGSQDDAFFWLSFENHPLDESADSSLYIKTKSITIFYNAHFIESVARFFKPPKTHLETIGAIINAAGATVEGIRDQTRIGLEYALQEHKTANVKLDLQAPLIVLPLDVTSWSSPCAIIDAGHISLISDLAPSELLEDIKKKQSHQYQDKDWEKLESLMYDKFKLQLHDTQILIGTSVRETMKQLHNQEIANPSYVIGRINMDFLVEISILPEAYNLTKFKVTGHLPVFRASMSDSKYKLMMQIIDKSIPNFDFEDEIVEDETTHSPPEILSRGIGLDLEYDSFDDRDNSNSEGLSRTTSSTDLETSTVASSVQLGATSESQKIFVFIFKVDKVELSLHRCIDDASLEQTALVDMVLEEFELEYCFRSLEMTADVVLRSLRIEDYIDTKCPSELRQIVSSTTSTDGKSDLFNVKYRRIKLPLIKETGEEPFDQIVEVSMSTIRFVVEPRTFLTILDFIITTFTTPEPAKPATENNSSQQIDSPQQIESGESPQESVAPSGQGSIDVRVNLKSIILILNDDSIRLATLKLDSALVSVRLFEEKMDIRSRIGSLSLQDDVDERPFSRESTPEKLISIEGSELADFRYETFDRRRTDISYNSSIYFRLGSLKVNVIEKPLARIFSFLSKFNQMKGLYDRARQLAMNQANQIESPDKIRFDIVIKTPIFVFPTVIDANEDICDSLTAHLGEIYLQNKFEPISGVEGVVVNNISAGVRDVKLISKFYFDNSWFQDLKIIDKIDMGFDISYVTEYKGITRPTLIVNGSMSDIKLKLTERQFQYLMSVLRTVPAIFSDTSGLDEEEVDELAEELRQNKRIEPISEDLSRVPSTVNTANGEDAPVATVDKLDLTFSIKTVSLTLYHGTLGVKQEDIEKHTLSHFSLNDSGIKVLIKKDSTLESDIHVHSFTVRDTRTMRENKFPEIIPSVDYGEYQFMCKVTQYDNLYDILLTIDSPQMILALDYLFALKGFLDFGLVSDETYDEENKILELDQEVDTAATQDSSFSFGYHINVVDFSVILLADPSSENSEALVFKAEQLILSQRTTTTLAVSKVGMFLCEMSLFNEGRLRVLDDFSMTATIDTTGSDATHQLSSIQISVEPLVLRLSLRDILLVLNIIQRASALSENETKELEAAAEDNSPKYSRFSKTEKRKLADNARRRSSVGSVKMNHRRASSVSKKLALPEIRIVRGEEMTADFEGLRLVVIGAAHELPVIDMCVKPFSISARSWSSDLRVDMAAESFVNVFNPAKSAWEPLVETWDVGFNMSRSTDFTNTFVNIYSRKPIEIALTSQTIELLTKSIDFVSVNSGDNDFLLKPRDDDAPYSIRNETGYAIEVWSDFENPSGVSKENKVERIEDGQEIPWRFYDWHVVRENLSTDLQKVSLGVDLKDSPFDEVRAISVTSEGEHLHILYRGAKRTGHRLLCDVVLENYRKKIVFRSTLNVKNSTHIHINLSVNSDKKRVWILKPGETRAIPINLVHECRLSVMPEQRLGFKWSREGVYWKDLLENPGSLSCDPLPNQTESPFYFHVEADFDKTLPIAWLYPYMTVNFCAPVEVVNLLPYDISYRIFNKTVAKDWTNFLKKGETSPVHVVKRTDFLLLSVHPDEAGYDRSAFAIINAPKGGFSREKVMTTHSKDRTQRLNIKIHYL